MAPVPTEGTSTASPMSHQSIPKNTAEMFPVTVVPSDQNDNYVAVNGEDLFTLPPVDGGLYTSVDQQFLELMLDAVQKGFMPPELATAKTWLNTDSGEVDLNGSSPSPVTDIDRKSEKEIGEDHLPPSLGSTGPISLANGPSNPSFDSSCISLSVIGEPQPVESDQLQGKAETISAVGGDQTAASAEAISIDDLPSLANIRP